MTVTTQMMRSALASLGLFACTPSAIPVGSVEAAPGYAEADKLALTGVSVPSLRGIAPTEGGEMWVVPVANVGEDLGDTAHVWLSPPAAQRVGSDPEIWLAEVRVGFDKQGRSFRVAAQADSDGSRAAAIRDAVARHGLQTHPNAPVLVYPEP